MEPLSIAGIGVISSRGRGLEAFEKMLCEGWTAPEISKDGRAAYRLKPEDLSDKEVLQRAKRADRFGKLMVLAAHDAVKDSGLPAGEIKKTTGIIAATAFGAHSSIFKFLDGIIDYGETKVSPTVFAHSIHNAAAAYVAGALETAGPVLTVTQFYFSLHHALQLAYAWLREKRVERVLVGVADECSPAMEYICEEKLTSAKDGKMDPLSFSEKPGFVPGEACVYFLLSLNPAEAKHGTIADIQIGKSCRGWDDTGLSIIEGNGMSGSEAPYKEAMNGKPAVSYAPLYGGIMSSGAMECIAAALMLRNQVRYVGPVFDKIESGKNGVLPEAIAAVQCVSRSCEGEFAFLKLKK